MKRTHLLPVAFSLLLLGAWRSAPPATLTATSTSISALKSANPPLEPGSFPRRWINGVDCGIEPNVQVHAYNQNLFILRESKCKTHEAPFVYLIFGEEKALLLDTGATLTIDLWSAVDGVVQRWVRANGRTEIPLLVTHSHSHNDHVAGDSQFVGKPYVETVVGTTFQESTAFWGFQDYPNDVPTIDLGNRVIDILGTPGHLPGSVTLYDRRTQLLLTGDIVYPGHLFVFTQADFLKFVTSLDRLTRWAQAHPVEWVVGCHIETSSTDFAPYAWGTAVHPDEHVLEFPPSKLAEIYHAARAMNGDPQCTIFDEFVIHPVYKCGITWNG